VNCILFVLVDLSRTIIAGVGLGLRTVRGTSFCLIQLGPKTGEVEERWGDPTAAGRDGQERGGDKLVKKQAYCPTPKKQTDPARKRMRFSNKALIPCLLLRVLSIPSQSIPG